MVMVTEVFGCGPSFVLAIGCNRCPTELQRHQYQQKNHKQATHGQDCSSYSVLAEGPDSAPLREGLQNLPARLPGWDNSDMKQMSLEAPMYTGFELRAKRTRKRAFLEQMDRVVPWAELVALIEPYAPKAGPKGGRPPFAVEKLLRIHFLQQWFGLSDPAVEEALYDTPLLASFVGLDLGVDVVPDESTILRFRHLLEQHGLSQRILETVNRILTERGLMLKSGTIVDATLIAAPSSTKNARRERDPEMHQTKKGNQWYFGMKAHVGVDAETGLVHTVVATAANVSDVTQAHRLLHGQETDVFADAGYQGVDRREENQGKQVAWHVAMRPGKRRALDKRSLLGAVVDAARWSARKHASAPRVSIRFGCSNASSATARRSIGAWPRTAHSSMSCSPWSICGWRAKPCWLRRDKCARSGLTGAGWGSRGPIKGLAGAKRRLSICFDPVM